MRAAVVEQYKKPLVVENVPDPVDDAGGVIVDVKKIHGVARVHRHPWGGYRILCRRLTQFGR